MVAPKQSQKKIEIRKCKERWNRTENKIQCEKRKEKTKSFVAVIAFCRRLLQGEKGPTVKVNICIGNVYISTHTKSFYFHLLLNYFGFRVLYICKM